MFDLEPTKFIAAGSCDVRAIAQHEVDVIIHQREIEDFYGQGGCQEFEALADRLFAVV
jgi:hypothetical protein